MSQKNERSSKGISGILALVALVATGVCGYFSFPAAEMSLGLGVLLILAIALEGLSTPLVAAGYVSLAAPLYFVLLFRHGEGAPVADAQTALFLAVAVCGIASLARLAGPATYSMNTKLASLGGNVLRIGIVGTAAFFAQKSTPHVIVAVIAAYAAWLVVDLAIVSPIFGMVEEEEYISSWQEVLRKDRFILALPPVAGVLGAGLSQGPGDLLLASLATATVALPFRGTIRYTLDEIVVKDQDQLEMHLKTAQHQVRTIRQTNESLTKEKKQLTDELKSVYDMARSLGASTQLEETVGIVLAMVRRLRIPFQSCVILLYRNGNLTPVLSETPYRDVLAMSHLLQLEESLIKEVVESRKPRLKPEISASSEGRIFKDERSVMAVPLSVSKEIVGVIYVGSVHAGTHTEEHLDSLKMLAAFAAPSVKTAILFEDKEKDLASERRIREAVEAKNAQLAGLQQMGQKMGATLKTSKTMEVVSESLRAMVPDAQSVILFTPDREATDGHALKAEYADTPFVDFVRLLALRDDEGLLGKAIKLGTTILVQDTEMYEVQNLLGSEHSVVVAPLIGGSGDDFPSENDEDEIGSELLGCLYVGAAKENAFNEEHRNIIETVSYQTAMALKNTRLYEQTQQMALTDGLTGLYTHRLFQEKLVEEVEWASRHNQTVVLVMVDADNFKTFNDTLGHPAGDALLKEIAALLKDKVRSTDIVCRYGGDEFALLLKNTQKDDAIRMCERIREAFQLRFGGNEVQVTSSIGLACFPGDADSKADLAQAADDALYVSKRGGRNRVSASPTLEERRRNPIEQEVLPRG